ncbi:MAG: hypothetical protein EOP24_28040 [Hyphomicrobiales bacterium]|nr:MAG: hypothetical protein EOP24_28040 [Hyphomicrobiales bacterium]
MQAKSAPSSCVETEIRRYRRLRLRQREQRRAEQPRASNEAEYFIEFAQSWAPYGGAPEEEVFVQFGMTSSRFAERLRQIVSEMG